MPPQKRARSSRPSHRLEQPPALLPRKCDDGNSRRYTTLPHQGRGHRSGREPSSTIGPRRRRVHAHRRESLSEKYRRYLNKATACRKPTYAMMNFGGKNAWAFYAGGPDSDPEYTDMYTLDLRFSADVVITKVIVEGFTFGRTKLALHAGKDERNKVSHIQLRPGRRCWDAFLPAHARF